MSDNPFPNPWNEIDRLRGVNTALVKALEGLRGAPPAPDLPCHRGITTMEKCGRCSREAAAIAALTLAGQEGGKDE